MSVSPRSEKFNIVSNDQGRTRKCGFCVSVCKTNFTDHHLPNTIHCFRDSFPVCKMHRCMTRKNFEHFHSLPSTQAMQAITRGGLGTNHFKMLLNVFSTTYTHSNYSGMYILCIADWNHEISVVVLDHFRNFKSN